MILKNKLSLKTKRNYKNISESHIAYAPSSINVPTLIENKKVKPSNYINDENVLENVHIQMIDVLHIWTWLYVS